MAPDADGPAVELVALLASAGGLEALSTVLRDLPTDLPVGIVVQQHLGSRDSVLPTILRRQAARRVSWAQDGQALAPGQVVVGPPGTYLELTPDGRCRLRNMEARGERRFDVLLASIASSYGPRSVGVVLSGSGRDGAGGTVAMKQAGAIVIAESPETARYPSMPIAAARAGADLVIPVHEIGRALAGIVEGAPLPKPQQQEAGWAAMSLGPFGQFPANRAGGNTATADVEATNSAPARAELARLRAAEVRQRRQDLSTGFGATAQTVATARRRAEESRRRAQLAHQAAEEAAARGGAERQAPTARATSSQRP